MSFSGSQITRLGLGGIPRGLYGSFVGKAPAALPTGAEVREIVLLEATREITLDGYPRELVLISPSREVE